MFTKPTLPTTHQPGETRSRVIDQDKAQLYRQVRLLTSEVVGLEEQLQAMRRSTSWRVSAPLRWLSRRLQGKAAPVSAVPGPDQSYGEWVRLYDSSPPGTKDRFCAGAATQGGGATFSIVLAPNPGQGALLAASVDALLAQDYPYWQLVVVTPPGELAEVQAHLGEARLAAPRVELVSDPAGESKATAFNRALAHARGDWMMFLEPGDVLAPVALGHFAIEIARLGDSRIIYCDEDSLDGEGQRVEPRFKPDWNLDLFHSQNYVSHAAVYARPLIDEVGGFCEASETAASYDLILRCVERLGPGKIRRIPRVLIHKGSSSASMDRQEEAEQEGRVLAQHLDRLGVAACVSQTAHWRRVRYRLPAELPLVTLLIPTRNGLSLLRQCVESIVTLTTYPNYEILLIDNGSDAPDALAYLADLDGQPGITVIRDDREFNYSALNNMAAGRARGSVLGLINNDIEVISPDWLDEMVSLAMQPGVGAVGAKLLYPDQTVQHGGVLLGVGGATGVAGHANKFLPATEAGYMHRSMSVQSFSAVTAACLVVRKALYEQLGGLNEIDLKIAYNDVDFCLRLREVGYRNVWTPHAELFHHESATRGSDFSPAKRQRFDQEQDYMRSKWRELIADDPAYNPNLTVYAEDFGLAWPPRVPWITGAAAP